jgi:predicted molibdopterin-dependent oxidoreductase YjgC
MSTEPLFKQLASAGDKAVCVTFNDMQLQAPAGSNLAAALLAAGIRRFRGTPVTGSPRAPYCMMGVCFECLVEIDGTPNCQSCLESVRDGMVIRSQEGVRQVPSKNNDETFSSVAPEELR